MRTAELNETSDLRKMKQVSDMGWTGIQTRGYNSATSHTISYRHEPIKQKAEDDDFLARTQLNKTSPSSAEGKKKTIDILSVVDAPPTDRTHPPTHPATQPALQVEDAFLIC